MSGFDQELRDVLPMVHNSFRFGAPNEPFSIEGGLEEGNTEFSLEDVDPAYFVGLLTPAIIMSIFIICWVPSFLCTGFCLRDQCCCKNLTVAKCWFFLNMSLVILTVLISIRGINYFKDGSVDGLDGIIDLAQEVVDSADILESTTNDIEGLQVDIDLVEVNCGNVNGLPDIDDLLEQLDVLQVIEFAQDLDVELIDTEDSAEVIIGPLTTLFNAFIAITVIYLIFFMGITCVAIDYDSKQRAGKKVDTNTCAAETAAIHRYLGCLCFTSCNILLSWSLLTFAIVAGYLGMIGADQCVPSFSEDILIFISGDENANIEELCGLQDLDNANDQQEREYFFCHYLFCEGDNLLLQDIGVTENRDNDDLLLNLESEFFLDTIQEIDDLIAVADNNQACINSLTTLRDEVVRIHEGSMLALEIITCDTMTPIIRGILDDAACNGVIAGVCIIFICWLSASIFLMLAMNAYPAILFYPIETNEQEPVRNNVIPTAVAVSEAPVDEK